MANNRLASKLLALEGFQKKFTPILLSLVSGQFPLEKVAEKDVHEDDINYLLTCASILAQSENSDCQSAALRIAHYVLSKKKTYIEQKRAALVILDTMTNYSAIALAKEKRLVEDSDDSELPLPLLMDLLRRKFQYTILNAYTSKTVVVNRFQEKVYREYTSADALSISAPTSSGKSFILLQIILDFIETSRCSKIVYIVPTRALIQQVSSDVNELLSEHKVGNVVVSSVPTVIPNNDVTHFYVLTQERLHWILNDAPTFSTDCLVIDEAQKVGDGARGVILQQVIEEVEKRSKEVKVLFASPMTENPELLLGLLSESKTKKEIVSDQVTVNQNLIWVNSRNAKDKSWNMQLCIPSGVLDLGCFVTEYRPSSPGKRMPFVAHALGREKGGNLLYANGAAEAEKIARLLYDLQKEDVDDEKLTALIDLVKKTIHLQYDLATVLKRRIAFHYGNMPLIIRHEIEKLFKEGCIKFLVCTSTLMEGVNLPAKTIFIRGPKKGKGNPMNAVDFGNLAGRAGRQGKEFQGNIICVDTESPEVWSEVFRERVKYPITSSVDDAIRQKGSEIVQYIDQDIEGTLKQRNLLYDHAITYLINDYENNGKKFSNKIQQLASSPTVFSNLVSSTEKILGSIDLPPDLVLRHQGISPVSQQGLYTYFREYAKDFSELIPLLPEELSAVENYNKIISRIQKYIDRQPHSKISFHRAMLVVNWMRGYTLARIIKENERFYSSGKSKRPKKLPTIIRDTMQEVEEYVRFTFIKQSACYIDILKYHFQSTGNALADEIPTLNVWLEFGASQGTQISLMNLGISRTSAIALSEYIAADNYDEAQCLDWIASNSLDKLDLSSIIVEEVLRVAASSYLSASGDR